MSKRIRDFIFLAFIIIFIIGTVLASLYASGYKINFSWPMKMNRLLIKTGMIILDSVPHGATIYLDGRPQTNFSLNPWKKEYLTTAAKIKNVLPGEYDLSLKLDDYWPLDKKINVYSGQTTYLEDINLFRSDLPLFITAASTSPLTLSASNKYLYVSGASKIISLGTGQEKVITAASAAEGQWLKNDDKLVAAGWIFNPSGADVNYGELIGANARDWYLEEKTGRLYYRNQDSLGYFDLAKDVSVLAAGSGNYLTYEPRGDTLFFIATEEEKTILKKYSLRNQTVEQEINLPGVGRYIFSREGRKFLTLYDDQNQTLYLFNPDNLAAGEETIKNVVSWIWLDDNTLLYNNNWEIYLFDLKQQSASLLTRVGEGITKIVWNSKNNYLIFSTANSLNTLDLKLGTITKIFQTEKISPPVLDDKTGTLYFGAKIGQREGAYSLLLQ